jgi:NAD+ kinase
MKIGLVINEQKSHVYEPVQELVDWFRDQPCEVYVESVEPFDEAPNLNHVDREELARVSEVVVVFGGDGTLLDAAHAMAESETPILGVNSGGLGFLTETTLEEMKPAIKRVLENDYEVQQRMMIQGTGENTGGNHRIHALNDIVLSRARLGRVIQVAAFIDGDFVTSYVADGIIISTPTGSTAYNLSANGPIVHPELQSIVLNPICPHTLTNRPLIIPPQSEVELEIESSDECILTGDGQDKITNLHNGDRVRVGRSPRSVSLIKPEDRDFYTILRTKLHWGGRTT